MVKKGGIYIAAGSNLGDRAEHILGGLRDLARDGDIVVLQRSTLRETEAVGGPRSQGPFLNATAELATELGPFDLLSRLMMVERLHGRERNVRNGPRTLDLDLLLHGELIIDEAGLCVPHPRMWERAFVMEPLREICPAAKLARVRRMRAGDDSSSSAAEGRRYGAVVDVP